MIPFPSDIVLSFSPRRELLQHEPLVYILYFVKVSEEVKIGITFHQKVWQHVDKYFGHFPL
jgi:hypothetical protein